MKTDQHRLMSQLEIKTCVKFIGNGIIIVFSLLVAFLGVEVLIRLNILGIRKPIQTLFRTVPNFELDTHGGLRLAKNVNLREVMLFDHHIEYDVTYRTNNEGFIDPEHYRPNKFGRDTYTVAFVGDSFGAGVGSDIPWVPRVRDTYRTKNSKLDLLNLSVPGTGIIHFQRILESVALSYPFEKIYIVAISNDFNRLIFYTPVTPIIANNQSIDSVILSSQEVEKTIFKEASEREYFWSFRTWPILKKAMKQTLLFRNIFEILGLTPKPQGLNMQAKKILREIKERFPNVPLSVIHLPEKQEVQSGHYEIDLKEDLNTLNISYYPLLERCAFSMNSFLPKDSHPSKIGYSEIEKCIYTVIDAL